MKFKTVIHWLLSMFILGFYTNDNENISNVILELEKTQVKENVIEDRESSNQEDKFNKIEENINTEPIYSLDDIIHEVDKVAGENKDKISFYYYNFDTKDEYYFNENTYYVSASLKKVPLVMQVLDKVVAGELTLDTKVAYDSETDYMNGTGILQVEEHIGERTVGELIELSILESDNIAFNMLNKVCGYTLVDYIREITGDSTIPEGEYSRLTAKQNFDILYRLYTNPYKNKYYEEVIELMKKTAFHDRFDKYIPHHKVAHKIGSYYRYYHDEGIIFAREKYILVIMSKDIGILSDDPQFTEFEEERVVIDWGEEACDIIARISKSIYDIIETGTVSSEKLIEYEPIKDEKEITNEAYGSLKNKEY